MMRRRSIPIGLLTAALACGPSLAAPLNLYEWAAVAPIVVTGEIVGDGGGFAIVKIDQVLRGELSNGERVQVHLRRANRQRSRNADPKALHFEFGPPYILLLEDAPPKKSGEPVFRLARGVRGARRLPAEGSEATLAALHSFIEIQDARSETVTWKRFSEMLGEPNPILLENALDQFLKFRRGSPDLLLSLRPLMTHPRHDLRERTVRLVGQIVGHHPPESLPEETALRTELIGSARRDESVAVRVAATEALGGFSGPAVRAILEEIAASDPDQAVRFAAEKLLYNRRQEARAASR